MDKEKQDKILRKIENEEFLAYNKNLSDYIDVDINKLIISGVKYRLFGKYKYGKYINTGLNENAENNDN
jgi:hypothetical protein